MKLRRIVLVAMLLLLVTGCKTQKLYSNDIDKNIDIILNRDTKYVNHDAIGFQYYLPSEVNVSEVKEFNHILYSKGNKYYLYADVVSYYHKVKNKYKINKKAYYSKTLSNNKKIGYLEINKENGKYYVEMMYNYAKIEAFVKKNELNDTIINMCYILSSVRYNDDVVETMLGDSKYDLSENEKYNIFNTKKEESSRTFLDYVNEYDNYDGEVKNLIEQEEIDTKKDN